jgi:hypothetical protein
MKRQRNLTSYVITPFKGHSYPMTPSKATIGNMRFLSDSVRQIVALLMVSDRYLRQHPASRHHCVSHHTRRNERLLEYLPILPGALSIVTRTAFIPFITDMVDVAKSALTGQAFIPSEYNPTELQVVFVGAMGILGIIVYSLTLPISFLLFSLYA